MSNKHKEHIRNDKHDEHFIKHVESSTYVVEHELAEIDKNSKKVHDLASLLPQDCSSKAHPKR